MKSKKSVLYTTLVLFGIFVVTYFLQLPDVTSPRLTNSLFLLAPALAVAGGLYALSVYRLSSVPGRITAFLTAGLACWFIGEGLFYYFQFVTHTNPFPSIADAFYIVAYPLLFIGLVKEVKSHRIKWKDFNQLVLLLSGLLALVLIFIIGYFDIYLAYQTGDPLLNNAISIGYGIGDLILIIPVFFILKIALDYRGGKLFYSWMMVLFALLFVMVGDILFAIYSDQYEALTPAYTLIDLTWIAGYLLFAYSFYYNARTIKELQSTLLKK